MIKLDPIKQSGKTVKKGIILKLAIILLPIAVSGLLLTSFALVISGGGAGVGAIAADCSTDDEDSISSATATISTKALSSDPFTVGSETYNNFKTVWDYLTDTLGYSGAGAAGVLGNMYAESGGDPTAENTSGGVAGIFQWSGFSNTVNGSRITSEGSIKAGDTSTLTMDNEMKLLNYELTGSYASVNSKVGTATDVTTAASTWQQYFEGASGQGDATRQAAAEKFYNLFNGSSVSADESKLKAASSGTTSTYSSSSSSSDSDSDEDCDSSSSGGGTGTWATDGGTVTGYRQYSAWTADSVPDNLKQYALDPKSVGLTFRSSTGWNAIASTGGQCTDFTASLGYALWEKNGQHPTQTAGNGEAVAGNWASKFGGSTTTTPTAGAIFSQTPASAGNVYGHTGIVSHIFENGDILVVEQNYSNLSGEDGGYGQYTWSYRYVPKSTMSGWTFFDPSTVGYSIVDNAASIG